MRAARANARGVPHRSAGSTEGAKEHCATFLETFTDPDPECQWTVTEARAALEAAEAKAKGR